MQHELAKIRFDLSCSQDQIYLGQKLFGRTPEYNLTFSYALPAPIDLEIFRRAFDCLVTEADCLRLRVEAVEGRAVQTIEPGMDLALDVVDFSNAGDPRAAFSQWAQKQASAPVDAGRLVQGAWLAVLAAGSAQWVISIHHLAADSWGLYLLYKRLLAIYTALLSGQAAPAPALPPLALLLKADEDYRSSPGFRQDHLFWRKKTALAAGPLALYGTAGNGQVNPARRVEVDLEPGLVQRLIALSADPALRCQSANIRLFNLLLTAYAAYLHRVSGQDAFMVGVPYLNRPGTLRDVPGLTKSVAPLYLSLKPGDTFRDLFETVCAESAQAAEHSRYPVPDPSNQLFNTIFNFHNRAYPGPGQVETWWYSGRDSIDLSLNVFNPDLSSGQIRLGFDLSYEVFPEGQEEKVIRHFLSLLAALAADPDARVLEAPMLSEQEIRQVVVDFNPPVDFQPGRILVERLADLAAHFPDQTAVETPGGDRLTCAELDRLSSRLAWYLRRRGAGPGTAVGLHAERSPGMIAAFLAIFKSGAAYVPLDPGYPADRLAFMIEDAGIQLVLAGGDAPEGLNAAGAQVIRLEEVWDGLPDLPEGETLPLPGRDDTAYINYTSGSTGRPKGVEISQGALADYLDAIMACYRLAPGDRLLFFSAQGSDAVYEEIFPILLAGGTLVLKPERLLSLAEFNELVTGSNVTVLSLPAVYWGEWTASLAAEGAALPAALRMMLVYAEEPSLPRYLDWRGLPGAERVRWINTYGPTETTITSSIYEPDPAGELAAPLKRVPIGYPLPNHQIYILDGAGGPVALGVPGEIVIAGGAGVGYRNRPDETAARFIPGPFSGLPGRRMYRTGDRGRHLPDGSIEFLGRLDAQIKLNGFRIEPGEIESRLLAYPGVRQAAVTVRENDNQTRRLAAYLTLKNGHAPEPDDIRAYLKQFLPDYMIPADFAFLAEMPLNAHGKLDRRALPRISGTQSENEAPGAVARTALEGQLLGIWEDVLGIAVIGIDQDFFQLGGNSLLGVRLFAQLEHKLGLRLPVSELFNAPTVRKLAAFIEQYGSGYRPSTLVLIRPGGPGLPFFLVHGWGGGVVDYADLSRSISPHWPIYGLQAAGLTREEPPDTTIEAMVERYVAAMKTVQPRGPYRLGGYCTGGVIAYALACRLEKLGDAVDMVAIIEGEAPGASQHCPPLYSRERISTITHSLPYWVSDYRQLGLKGIRQRILYKLHELRRLRHRKGRDPVEYQMDDIILDNPTPLPDIQKEILLIELKMMEKYVPEPFSGRVAVYSARYPTISGAFSGPIDPTQGWTELARGGVSVYTVASSHRNIHLYPNSILLGRAIQDEIEKAEADLAQSSSL